MSKPTTSRSSPRMVFDHQAERPSQWAAINSMAGKIGCTGETLRSWVRQAERDQGLRGGATTEDSVKIIPTGGRIMLTSSISTRHSVLHHTRYAASKAAVSAIVLHLAGNWA